MSEDKEDRSKAVSPFACADGLTPEWRTFLALRLRERRSKTTSEAHGGVQTVSRIRDQLMVLSNDLIERYLELIRQTHKNVLTEAEFTQVLRKTEEELAVLQRKVENEEITEASLAMAKEHIHFIVRYIIDQKVQDSGVWRMGQRFIIDHLTRELLKHPKYKFTQDWFYYHIRQWEEDFGYLRDEPRLRFLEIGCFEGRCTCWLLDNILTHETSTITCIDPFEFMDHPKQEEYFDFNIEKTGVAHKVTKLRGYSQNVLGLLPSESYDFIYVDGSHSVEDVLQDAVSAWRLLKRNGVVVFDDYELETIFPRSFFGLVLPRPAIDAFLATFKHRYEMIHKGWQVAIRKLC